MEKVIKVWLKYYPVYLSGLWGTLWISAVTVFLGALLGMVVALMRMSRLKILRTAFNVYVEILRGPHPSPAVFLLDRSAQAGAL